MQAPLAWTSTVDVSVPFATRMFELLMIPPRTLKGSAVFSAFTYNPSSAGFVDSVRMALPGLFDAVIGPDAPAAPVEGSGEHWTAAEFAAAPVDPGIRLDCTRTSEVAPLPKHLVDGLLGVTSLL